MIITITMLVEMIIISITEVELFLIVETKKKMEVYLNNTSLIGIELDPYNCCFETNSFTIALWVKSTTIENDILISKYNKNWAIISLIMIID